MKNIIRELGESVVANWSEEELKKEITTTLPVLRTAFLEYMDSTANRNWKAHWHLYEYDHGPRSGNVQRLFATRFTDKRFIVYFRAAKVTTPLTSGIPPEEFQAPFQKRRHVWKARAWMLEHGSKANIKRKKKGGQSVLAPKSNPFRPYSPWFIKKDVTVSFANMATVGSFARATQVFKRTYLVKLITETARHSNKRKMAQVKTRVKSAGRRV